jgi:hypothetical protein
MCVHTLALKDWQIKKLELFLKKVYNHAGLDTFWHPPIGVLGLENKQQYAKIKSTHGVKLIHFFE